jgi:hypothetical protein
MLCRSSVGVLHLDKKYSIIPETVFNPQLNLSASASLSGGPSKKEERNRKKLKKRVLTKH